MKRKLSFMIAACLIFGLCLGGVAFAVVYNYAFNAGCDGGKWDPSGNGGWVYYKGMTVKLQKGCFIQYIYAGANNSIEAPSSSGEVTGDDVLLATWEVGQDFLGLGGVATFEGEFWNTYSGSEDGVSSPKIYVRAWSTNEARRLTGSYYGNSILLSPAAADEFSPFPSPNDIGIPSFEVSIYFDMTPPSPSTDFTATQDASGDIILSWTPTSESDVVGTLIRWSTTGYPSSPTDPTSQTLTDIPTTAASQAYRQTDLVNGTTVYYSAFTYDISGNYSVGAHATQTSHDTLPPNVIGWSPTGTGVDLTANISVTFDDNMDRTSAQAALQCTPSLTVTGYNWTSSDKTVEFIINNLTAGQTYTVTMATTAKDTANNYLAVKKDWTFSTSLGLPPAITDLKIGGWKRYPGDTISSQPKISGTLGDPESSPEASGIVTVDVYADGTHYTLTGPSLAAVYDNVTGYFSFMFPIKLPAGTYNITLEVWDISGNPTRETVEGLVVKSGAAQLESMGTTTAEAPLLIYPNPMISGVGTKIVYSLTVDSDVTIFIYGIKPGSPILKVHIPKGVPGGQAGYNEYNWNGLNNFGETLGKGVYIVKVTANGASIGTTYLVVEK